MTHTHYPGHHPQTSDQLDSDAQPGFARTLTVDGALAQATAAAFDVLQQPEMRIMRQASLDRFLARLAPHLRWRLQWTQDPRLPRVANLARDYLHEHVADDIGLDSLAAITGTDRFRLSRAFNSALPLVAGGCVAASSMILLVGLGCGQLLLRYPNLRRAMAWVGVIWLSVIAFKLWQAAAEPGCYLLRRGWPRRCRPRRGGFPGRAWAA